MKQNNEQRGVGRYGTSVARLIGRVCVGGTEESAAGMGRDGAGRGDDDGGWIDGIRVCFYILGRYRSVILCVFLVQDRDLTFL